MSEQKYYDTQRRNREAVLTRQPMDVFSSLNRGVDESPPNLLYRPFITSFEHQEAVAKSTSLNYGRLQPFSVERGQLT